MKIEINTEVQLDVHVDLIQNGYGAIYFYFVSGQRYQYWVEWSCIGADQIHFLIEDGGNNDIEVGEIIITGETEEEKNLINSNSLWHHRAKETDIFLLLPFSICESVKSLGFVRHNW